MDQAVEVSSGKAFQPVSVFPSNIGWNVDSWATPPMMDPKRSQRTRIMAWFIRVRESGFPGCVARESLGTLAVSHKAGNPLEPLIYE
jgi:hypothetical protein